MEKLFNAFQFDGQLVDIANYGNGHINDTYRVVTTTNQYIIQRINHYVFKQPDQLMANYRLVTDYLKTIVEDPNRQTLTIIPTKENKDYYVSEEGNYYRAIAFIDNCICLETMTGPDDFYKTGVAFGNFQTQLANFDASTLYESIPNFHNTPKRFDTFMQALNQASEERKSAAKEEIEFIINHKKDAYALYDMNLPLRVTHNDTKLNNILFDGDTKEALCIIDLDTIMPGFVANDFGDSIRSGATYSKEDEQNLDLVTLDLDLYQAFFNGFVDGANTILTPKEIESLPVGAKTITLEQAIRFLTDYLENDVYYKTDYPEHNLVRTKTQIKLVQEMEKYHNEIQNFLKK